MPQEVTKLTIEEMLALDEAIRILAKARMHAAPGSRMVWRFIDHAMEHLDKQIEAGIKVEA